ncbi:GNAT family N-acetyltransferase [Paenibacillus rhizovicinus]|uniref:GNAT family N-acetyltransferase n=1 Tax=Paenibacillus rhizovicinus TaxID=2704463 RepID=UPI001CDC8013|nr:GNAT family N-acetyltransferase [Paenibacillus rhizovicinus]
MSQADSTDWGVYYSVYYNMAYNGFFKDQGLKMNHWRRKFWIHQGPAKIGGVVMAPNVIFGLFFIPPFNDEMKVVQLLKKALLNGSDRTKAILAYEILPNQIDLFSRAGFWPGEFRCRWMQRPTETFSIDWDDDLRIAVPEFCTMDDEVNLNNAEEISELSYSSYSGTLSGVRRQWTSREFFSAWTKQFAQESNENLRIASSLIYDNTSGQLVGACLVSLQDGMPALFNIAVVPSHRGKGIATKMIQRALSVLREQDYPILRLYVMQGNDAEAVYYNLGFAAGPLEVQHCYIPAVQQA